MYSHESYIQEQSPQCIIAQVNYSSQRRTLLVCTRPRISVSRFRIISMSTHLRMSVFFSNSLGPTNFLPHVLPHAST